jgi:predicted neutral ceramidase superfamily lipid hydrolase
MPYVPISNMSRRGEKVAPFLTIQNVLGVIALAAPAYALGAGLPPVLRVLITLALAILAYIATSETNGMAPYERVMWRMRGRARVWMRGPTLSPTALPDAVVQVRVPVNRRGGAVRLRLRAPQITPGPTGRLAARRTRLRPTPTVQEPREPHEVPHAHA